MRKLTLSILMLSALFTLSSCQKEENVLKTPENESGIVDELNVQILIEVNDSEKSGMPMVFTSRLYGETDKDLMYLWTITGIEPEIAGFTVENLNRSHTEIMNSGEPVTLELFSEVLWDSTTKEEYIVSLEVNEKYMPDVLAKDEVIIRNHAGIFTVIND